MKLYEFLLPVNDNLGRTTIIGCERFLQSALRLTGGYTQLRNAIGAWKADKDYYDFVLPVRVACSEEHRDNLLEIAFELFPDQKAIFVAEIGEATIYERETK